MKHKRFELLCWAVALLPLVLVLCCLPTLPDAIPMHWNVSGQVDRWGGRYSAFLVPLLTLGLGAVLVALPAIDPKRDNYEKFGTAYRAFRLVFNLFMLGMTGITLYAAYRPNVVKTGVLVPVAVGALFCVLGNYMPKFKHNYFVGIKTPWTLASESVWRSTHRLAGVLWVAAGLFFIVGAFVLPGPLLYNAVMAVILTMVLVPIVYSYLAFRREEKAKVDENETTDPPCEGGKS